MAAPTTIAELVERFERNRESYQAAVYNETQLRREFLDLFFKALEGQAAALGALRLRGIGNPSAGKGQYASTGAYRVFAMAGYN